MSRVNILTCKYIFEEFEHYKFGNFSQPWWNIQAWEKTQHKLWREIKSYGQKFVEIWKDGLILKEQVGNRHCFCLLFCLLRFAGWDILRKRGGKRKRGIWFWNRRLGNSVHLYCTLNKISYRVCLLFYCFLEIKKIITFKSSIYFRPLIIEFFCCLAMVQNRGKTPH